MAGIDPVAQASVSIASDSVRRTHEIASLLIPSLSVGDVVTLVGDLGAGKTCFSKGLIHTFSGEALDAITSPTFTLCQEYDAIEPNSATKLYHYDLYRLEDEEELEQLGFEEMMEQGASLIEWPEVACDYLPNSRLEVTIEIVDPATRQRRITLTPYGDWQERLAALSFSHD